MFNKIYHVNYFYVYSLVVINYLFKDLNYKKKSA